MTYSELLIKLDLLGASSVLPLEGTKMKNCTIFNNWCVVTDDGIFHIFDNDGNEVNISTVGLTVLTEGNVPSNVKKAIIPSTVKAIDEFAFYHTGLVDVVVPGNVAIIGEYAFSGCHSLVHATMLDGVKEITYRAFFNCRKLERIVVPSSVENIELWAFSDCPSLKRVAFEGRTRKEVESMPRFPFGADASTFAYS